MARPPAQGQQNLISAAAAANAGTSDGSASVSARSTPAPRTTPGPAPDGTALPGNGVTKMKFKPKVPIRRVKTEAEVHAEQAPVVPAMRGGRGRGGPGARGGAGRGRGRGGAAGTVATSVAAGVFGGPRPVASSSRKFTSAGPINTASSFNNDDPEIYSDHSDEDGLPAPTGGARPIDIEAVSTLGESAPTSLYRDRKLAMGKTKGKVKVNGEGAKGDKAKPKGARGDTTVTRVKPEPMSPGEQPDLDLDMRQDDAMLSADEDQDRDERGRRVRNFMRTGGVEDAADGADGDVEGEEVNTAQAIDLSESEEEEEEEAIDGDFVGLDGSLDPQDNPENKLFVFQFPHLFPRFHPPTRPTNLSTGTTAETAGTAERDDVKPDAKPTAAQLKAKKLAAESVPEGQVGKLVVMKSGKVKMVLGDDIVMDVSPGVPTTFTQQMIHLDSKKKAAIVLGDIHKNYVVTPDIDRLLQDLYLNGGKTPGDEEVEEKKRAGAGVGAGAGAGGRGGRLVKMEDY